MKKEDFEALGFTAEQAEKAAVASAEELKGFIPKHRFDEINEAKKSADELVKERDKQLDELKKSVKGQEELTAQITKLQEDNKLKDEAHAAELRKVGRKSIDDRLLAEAKAKKSAAVLALLEQVDDNADESAYETKRTEQINALIADESTKFLFDISEGSGGRFKGTKPPEGGGTPPGGGTGKNPWSKEHFNLTEQGRILREDPKLAEHYKSLK